MAFPTGWSRQCALTINHLKVPSSQSGFPALIGYNITSDNATNLPTEMLVSGGPNAAQSNGADIRFSSDSAGVNGLHFEIVYWVQDATTDANRKAEIWVNCNPSSSVDTTIYVWYKNPSATAPAANDATFGSQGVWDSNFQRVYHLPNGSTLTAVNSTATSDTGTITSTTATTGQIDGGAAFTGSPSKIALTGYAFSTALPFTVSAWVNPSNFSGFRSILGGPGSSMGFRISTSAKLFITKTQVNDATASTTALTANVWSHVAATYDGSGNVAYYVNGSPAGTVGSYSQNFNVNTNRIGAGEIDGEFFNGSIDEVRFSNSQRSADWIAAEYNNQFSPSTFWTVGTPVTVGVNSNMFFAFS